MPFNSEEAILVISALEFYETLEHKPMKPKTPGLTASLISKLRSLSALTDFTKEEYSLIAFALHVFNENLESAHIVTSFNVDSLCEKVLDLI